MGRHLTPRTCSVPLRRICRALTESQNIHAADRSCGELALLLLPPLCSTTTSSVTPTCRVPMIGSCEHLPTRKHCGSTLREIGATSVRIAPKRRGFVSLSFPSWNGKYRPSIVLLRSLHALRSRGPTMSRQNHAFSDLAPPHKPLT